MIKLEIAVTVLVVLVIVLIMYIRQNSDQAPVEYPENKLTISDKPLLKGKLIYLGVGDYTLADLKIDNIRSLRSPRSMFYYEMYFDNSDTPQHTGGGFRMEFFNGDEINPNTGKKYGWLTRIKISLTDFNQPASDPFATVVTLNNECGYKGNTTATLHVGSYKLKDLKLYKTLGSIKVPAGLALTVFTNEDFTGDSHRFTEDADCLIGGLGFAVGLTAASIKVEIA